MLKLECDRCKKISKEEIEPYGMEAHPMSQASTPPPASFKLPEGWTKVYGKHLCNMCTIDIEYALNHRTEAECAK